MQYCIYLRKSRADIEAEAHGEGDTLARHERALLDLAKRQKLNITAIYREVVSGETISARPVMQRLLAEVEQGMWAGVLVMEVERLARGDTIDQGIVAQAFRYSNTKIITPVKTYDPNNEFDEEYFEFGLFMSRREYKTINRRLQRGRLASVKEGKYVGNKPPYGYVRKKLERQKGYTLEPHPEQADVVRLIYELFTRERLGTSLVARRLNDLRIPPAKGDKWVPESVRGILQNPVYMGKIRWNWRPSRKKVVDGEIKKERPRARPGDWILTDGLHEPLVAPETWHLAQEYLATPEVPLPAKRTIKNPLAGLIVCGVCGRKMIRRPYTRDYPDTLMCPLVGCPNVSSALALVEERLLAALSEWLRDYRIRWELAEDAPRGQVEAAGKALKKVEAELRELERQRDNLHDLLERGIYSTEVFLERSRIVAARIEAAQREREALAEELRREKEREQGRREVVPRVERVLELYAAAEDPALKNALLKEVLEKAVYLKRAKGRWGKTDEFELTLYPKLPR